MEQAIRGADVIMMLRVQLERQNEAAFPAANISASTACGWNTSKRQAERHCHASGPH
jgi:aspartate carbamoyltransferase catalytic subunit